MQTMVAHMNEANSVLAAHFEEARREKELLEAEHAVAQQTWREEMDRLGASPAQDFIVVLHTLYKNDVGLITRCSCCFRGILQVTDCRLQKTACI